MSEKSPKKMGGKGMQMAVQKPKNFRKTFKQLLVSLKKYWWQIILGLTFAVISI